MKPVLIIFLTLSLLSPCIADEVEVFNLDESTEPVFCGKCPKIWDFLTEHESTLVRYPSIAGGIIGQTIGIPVTWALMPAMGVILKMTDQKDPFFVLIPLGFSILIGSTMTGGVPYLIYETLWFLKVY